MVACTRPGTHVVAGTLPGYEPDPRLLPAHHREEVTEEALFGPRLAVCGEAENRLRPQRSLLALVGG